MRRVRWAHLALLAASLLLWGSTLFCSSIWFDESFTVALMRHPLGEVISIAATDVHPPLYYILLWGFTRLFGQSLFTMRLFSLLPLLGLSLFGYTHIGKTFGAKVGLYFSALLTCTPILFRYATEIRMYSLALFFTTLAGYFAYRLYQGAVKTAPLFILFSVAAAYTHHFALVAVVAINGMVFLAAFKRKALRRPYLLCALLEILLFVPGLLAFLEQAGRVTSGYWIELKYPDILIATAAFFWSREGSPMPDLLLSGVIGIVIFLATLMGCIKALRHKKEGAMVAGASLLCCLLVVAVGLIASIKQPVFIPRYLLPSLGLFLFPMAMGLARLPSPTPICLLVPLVIACTIPFAKEQLKSCYAPENGAFPHYMEEAYREGDVILYRDIMVGCLPTIYFPDIPGYFYDPDHFLVLDAVRAEAYAPNLTPRTPEQGLPRAPRIWFVGAPGEEMVQEFTDAGYRQSGQPVEFYQPYGDRHISLTLFKEAAAS